MTRTARRPFSAPRPDMTRTALPAGLLAAATLALAAVFVFGLASRSNNPATGASPSASSSASPPATPSESPSASASVDTSTRAATVAAALSDCRSDVNTFVHAIAGNDLYVACGVEDGSPYIARVDLTTSKIVARYQTHLYSIRTVLIDGGSLWYGGTAGSACIDPCTGMLYTVRVDLATGKTALDQVDWGLMGDGLGYVWVREIPGTTRVTKVDPATGAVVGHLTYDFGALQFACGSMWGVATNNPYTGNATTTITRVDPATGAALTSFTEPGTIGELQQVGSECWTTAIASPYTEQSTSHFDRIGPSGIEFRSAAIPDRGDTAIFDGTFWAVHTGTVTSAQRIDPATLQPVGPTWTYTGSAPLFAAGGNLWAMTGPNNYPSWLERLNVPLE